MRGRIAAALGALGDNAEAAGSLWRGLGREADPGLRERIYASLHRVSQRAGVRVLESGEVAPLGVVRE